LAVGAALGTVVGFGIVMKVPATASRKSNGSVEVGATKLDPDPRLYVSMAVP